MKIKLIVAFAVGYVLGARAGRSRYEQIRRTAEQVQHDPRVREAAKTAEDFARQTADRIQHDDRVADAVSTVRDSAEKLRHQASDLVTGSGSGVAPEAGSHRADESSWPAHPDEHVPQAEDEVVYSAGPDLDTDIESEVRAEAEAEAEDRGTRP